MASTCSEGVAPGFHGRHFQAHYHRRATQVQRRRYGLRQPAGTPAVPDHISDSALLFLIRHYFLSQKNGNPHASLRINTWQSGKRSFSLQLIKGSTSGRITLPYRAVAEEHGSYD
jgi:hypothetical protein